MRQFALVGAISNELLTYQGYVITHTDKAELEFLVVGAKVIECPGSIPQEERLPLPQHPDFLHYRFPLSKGDFK